MTISTALATFTRPSDTTAYTANDLVANSTTAASVVAMTFGVGLGSRIRRVRMTKSTTSPTLATFTLFLFTTAPTVTNGDNGAFVPTVAGFIGSVAVDLAGSQSSGAAMAAVNLTTQIVAPSALIYGLLRADAGYTPGSAEVITVSLDVEA